jgi:hypothetical protein
MTPKNVVLNLRSGLLFICGEIEKRVLKDKCLKYFSIQNPHLTGEKKKKAEENSKKLDSILRTET